MKSFIKPLTWTGLMVIIVAAAYTAYVRWIKIEPLPPGLIQANGRIEGDHVTIAGKFQGRINKLLVREGDAVKKGQVVAVLDDSQVQARASVQAGAWDPAV
jgi:HlyD family secretion protein